MKSTRIFLLLSFLFVCCCLISAQNEHRVPGLIFEDDAYNQVPHLPQYEGKKYNEIPMRVSLKPFCPTPGDQGADGSCVGWAAGYAGLTISKAVKEGIENQAEIDEMAHSALYIYNQIINVGDDCKEGSRMTEALRILKEQGDCFSRSFDEGVENCSQQPTVEHHEEAKAHRIKDFAAVFNYTDEAKVIIDQTRKSLIAKKPVIVGINVTPSFWGIQPGQRVIEFGENEPVIGGHAMIVIGYDEILKSFELMNSWGTDFGEGGFIWISYEDFGKYTKYGFQIILDENQVIVLQEKGIPVVQNNQEVIEEEEVVCIVELKGDFVFRYPNGYEKDANGNPIIQFKEANAVLADDETHYKLTRRDWKVGDIFQLVARNIPSGKSVYVFSLDTNDKLELHWPKESKQIFDPTKDAFSSVPIATYLPSEDAEIIIPNAESALQLDAPGTDRLCVLYSDVKIENMAERMSRLHSASGDFQAKLKTGFGDLLIDKQQITYARQEMTFACSAEEGEGVLVPIVLEVKAY